MVKTCDGVYGDDRETCKNAVHSMKSLLEPFDYVKSVMQGMYIRDMSYNDLMDVIFKKHFKFKFNYHKIYANKDKNGVEYVDFDTYIELEADDLDMSVLSSTLNIIDRNDSCTFIYFKVPGHVNAHILRGNDVYIYEPHNKDYNYVQTVKKIYEKSGFKLQELPKTIMAQKNLPLCYMYVINFFLIILLYPDAKYKKYEIYEKTCDDLYIMKFTRDMLKLLKEYECITEWRYILLTNNMHALNEYLVSHPNFIIDINTDLFQYVTNTEILNIIIDRCNFALASPSEEVFKYLHKLEEAIGSSHITNIIEELSVRDDNHRNRSVAIRSKLSSLWSICNNDGNNLFSIVMRYFPSELFLKNELFRLCWTTSRIINDKTKTNVRTKTDQTGHVDAINVAIATDTTNITDTIDTTHHNSNKVDRCPIMHLKTLLNNASLSYNYEHVKIIMNYINNTEHIHPDDRYEILLSLSFDFLHEKSQTTHETTLHILELFMKQSLPPIVIDNFLFKTCDEWQTDIYDIIIHFVNPLLILKYSQMHKLSDDVKNMLCAKIVDDVRELNFDMKKLHRDLDTWLQYNSVTLSSLEYDFPYELRYLAKKILPELVDKMVRINGYLQLRVTIGHLSSFDGYRDIRTYIYGLEQTMKTVICEKIRSIVEQLAEKFKTPMTEYIFESKHKFDLEQFNDSALDISNLFRKINSLNVIGKCETKIVELDKIVNDMQRNTYNFKYNNVLTTEGKCSLLHAVKGKFLINVQKLLLEKDIDVDCKDDDGKTPIYYALVNAIYDGNYDIVNMLLNNKCKVSDDTFRLILNDDVKVPDSIIVRLIKNGHRYDTLKLIMTEHIHMYENIIKGNNLRNILTLYVKNNDHNIILEMSLAIYDVYKSDDAKFNSLSLYWNHLYLAYRLIHEKRVLELQSTFEKAFDEMNDKKIDVVSRINQLNTFLKDIAVEITNIKKLLDDLIKHSDRTLTGEVYVKNIILDLLQKVMSNFNIKYGTFTKIMTNSYIMLRDNVKIENYVDVVTDIFKNLKSIYLCFFTECKVDILTYEIVERNIRGYPSSFLWKYQHAEESEEPNNNWQSSKTIDEFKDIISKMTDRIDARFILDIVKKQLNVDKKNTFSRLVNWKDVEFYLTNNNCTLSKEDETMIHSHINSVHEKNMVGGDVYISNNINKDSLGSYERYNVRYMENKSKYHDLLYNVV